MNCEKAKEQFADYLVGDIEPSAETEIRAHIASCASCREELEGLSAVWTKLGVLPQEQPSGQLRANFYAVLEDYKQKRVNRFVTFCKEFWSFRKPAYSFSFGLALLIVGIGAGSFLTGRSGSGKAAALRHELQDMRQTVALSMLDRSSATERLEGIRWSAGIDKPGEKTIVTLVNKLDADSNVNVRLAAVDALYLFRDDPAVKESLIRSLAKQESPLVQVALIDLLVEIRERRAVDALKQLIGNAKLSPQVKEHAELGLKQII
jgi:anti-sigma factor RsiW